MSPLAKVLYERERNYTAALDRLREIADDESAYDAEMQLREAIYLVHCLRRLVDGRTVAEIHKAFGAPGDFGYETPIGDALIRLYRGCAAPAVDLAVDACVQANFDAAARARREQLASESRDEAGRFPARKGGGE